MVSVELCRTAARINTQVITFLVGNTNKERTMLTKEDVRRIDELSQGTRDSFLPRRPPHEPFLLDKMLLFRPLRLWTRVDF